MKKKLKVYGGMTCISGKGQVRGIVATTSQKNAAELFGCSLSHFRNYCGETGNEKELEIALANPNVLFVETKLDSDEYEEA